MSSALSAVALLLALSAPVVGQPDWYLHPDKTFPRDQFLYGLGVGSADDPAERMQVAEENARSNLIKTIRTQITSEFIDETTEASQRVDSYTQSRVTSTACLEVDGIRLEKWADTSGTAYALAVLDKAEGRRLHRAKLERLRRELGERLAEAGQCEREGEKEKALRAYLRIYPLLASQEETLTVLLALGDFGRSAFDELDQPPTDAKEGSGRAGVDAAVERLTSSNFANLDDAAMALAFRLGAQLPPASAVIVLSPTYGETKFTSAFSRYIGRTLAHKLVDAGLRPVRAQRGFAPRTTDHNRDLAQQAGAEIIVAGSYVEKGDRLKLFLLATDVTSGNKVGAADLELAAALAGQEGLDFLPQNFQQALQDAGVFAKGELVGGHLQVEVWTDRGSENLYLEEDEELTLAVRVNQPCHVRLLYHLANGMRAVLYDNYYIDQSKVNRAVVLPDTFHVAEPFGVEVIQALASTQPFPALRTRDWEGYPVLETGLEEFVAKTRGLKKKQKQRELAEARATLTTLPGE